MAERTRHIKNCGPYPGGRRARASLLLPALAASLLVAACSGGSSDDSGEDEPEPERRAVVSDEPQPVAGAAANGGVAGAGAGAEGDGGASGDAGDGGASSGEALDPGTLVRRLDRLVIGTDAHMLRFGLTAEAASPALFLDVLEKRLRSAQARLRGMRSSTPAGEGSE